MQKYFVDKAFPADGRSLYFDPDNPPKGTFQIVLMKFPNKCCCLVGCIPSHSLVWNRICKGIFSSIGTSMF